MDDMELPWWDEDIRDKNMSAMTDEQYEELTMLLEQLSPVRGKMKSRAQEFYDDQVKRHDEYGAKMFISPKQRAWLISLYEELVGPLDRLSGVQQETPEMNRRHQPREQTEDNDDEIPF